MAATKLHRDSDKPVHTSGLWLLRWMPSVALITLCIYRTKHCTLVPTSSYDGTIQGIVLVVKPAGHRLRVVTAGGRNYKLDANVEWISVGSIVAPVPVIPNSWLLWHQRSNAVQVRRLLLHLNVCNMFRYCTGENKMPFCNTSCLWKTVKYAFLRSVAVLLGTLSIKGTMVQILKTYG
jgi:hypothetical protein